MITCASIKEVKNRDFDKLFFLLFTQRRVNFVLLSKWHKKKEIVYFIADRFKNA